MEVESTAGSSVYDMGLGWEPSLGGLASSWELVADLTFTRKSGELDRRDPRNGRWERTFLFDHIGPPTRWERGGGRADINEARGVRH